MTNHETLSNIAKTVLGIETLETRNSDSLDFHDVAVWKLKEALQLAFIAGMQSTKKKSEKSKEPSTQYVATVEIGYQDLVDIFGEPEKGDQYKTEAEWTIRLPEGRVLTIYNYKNSRSYSWDCPPITEVKEWHIGGCGDGIVDTFSRMAIMAKITHRGVGA